MGRTKFKKPTCGNCRFLQQVERKNGTIPICIIYHKDVPWYKKVMARWCKNKHEFKGSKYNE